jgi:competence protein ComEC
MALLGAASLAGITLIVGWWVSRPDGRLHMVFLDVGQGDSIFVQTPSGHQILVDGGPDGAVMLDELGRQMPFWDRSLDAVVLTHADLDHLTGLLPVLERYRVGQIVFHDVGDDSAEYERWLNLVAAEGADVHSGETGLVLDVEEGLSMAVLHPPVGFADPGGLGHNNASIVMRVTYDQVSVLLPGDIEATVERQLLSQLAVPASVVLKLAHHGSCTSTTTEFLEAVGPDLIVISVGENDYGHPCDDVVQRLDDWSRSSGRSLSIYRTDRDGTVDVITDGQRLWVRTEE